MLVLMCILWFLSFLVFACVLVLVLVLIGLGAVAFLLGLIQSAVSKRLGADDDGDDDDEEENEENGQGKDTDEQEDAGAQKNDTLEEEEQQQEHDVKQEEDDLEHQGGGSKHEHDSKPAPTKGAAKSSKQSPAHSGHGAGAAGPASSPASSTAAASHALPSPPPRNAAVSSSQQQGKAAAAASATAAADLQADASTHKLGAGASQPQQQRSPQTTLSASTVRSWPHLLDACSGEAHHGVVGHGEQRALVENGLARMPRTGGDQAAPFHSISLHCDRTTRCRCGWECMEVSPQRRFSRLRLRQRSCEHVVQA